MKARILLAVAGCLLAHASAAAAATGPEVDVSQAAGAQSEATIAIDPTNDQILLAGSNSPGSLMMRAYSSTDGGATWTSQVAPPRTPGKLACRSDPAVGIDRLGRQYYAFIQAQPCRSEQPIRLIVATRPDAQSAWKTRQRPVVPASRVPYQDDKPALAVDVSPASPHANRVYLAWTRFGPRSAVGVESVRVVVSWSDDGGRTWSKPVGVDDGRGGTFAGLAVGRAGELYVSWHDFTRRRVLVDVSLDGGRHFGRDRLVTTTAGTEPGCGPGGHVIPAQPHRCVGPGPMIGVDTSAGAFAGRVYVSYATTGAGNSQQDVNVNAFGPQLQPLTRTQLRVAEPSVSDQFWPVAAVDPGDGRVWVCFYDTTGDPLRIRAVFSCSSSGDGGATWTLPMRAASVPSDETQLGTDPNEYGDYEGLAVANGVAHPVWTDSRDFTTRGEEIYTTRLTLP